MGNGAMADASVSIQGKIVDEIPVSLDGRLGVRVSRLENTSSGSRVFVECEANAPELIVELVIPRNWAELFTLPCHYWKLPITDAIPIFATLGVASILDTGGLTMGSHADEPVSTLDLGEVIDRTLRVRPAQYEEIRRYLEGKIYWSWKFRQPMTTITRSDFMRLNSTQADIEEVASLWDGALWTMTSSVHFKPTAKLIETCAKDFSRRRDRSERSLAVILFADMADSTRLASENEDAAIDLIRMLEEISKRSIADTGGNVVKFLGDGVLARFSNVAQAVRAGHALVQRFSAGARIKGQDTDLRVGIHMGEVVTSEDGDVGGEVVNLAARIQHVAPAGHIVMTEDAYHQIRRRPEFELKVLGDFDLKGVRDPMRLYDVRSKDVAS